MAPTHPWGADEDNPVRINNTLKYAGGTLTINTDPMNCIKRTLLKVYCGAT